MRQRQTRKAVLALSLAIGLCSSQPALSRCLATPHDPSRAVDDAIAADEVRDCLYRFQEAWRARDLSFIRSFFAHDADMLLFFERRQLRGWDDVETLYENMFAHALPGSVRSTYTNVDTRASGNLAYANANFHLTVTNPEGEEMTDEGRVTVVFERRDDRWVVIHRHTSFQAPPGPQRRVPRHEGPGPLWSATLEGAWQDDSGGFLLATADHLSAHDVPGLPAIARYVVDDGGVWLTPEPDTPTGRQYVETLQLTGSALSLRLPDGNRIFRRVE